MIREQFAKRNGPQKNSVGIKTAAQVLEEKMAKDCRVKAAGATATKVKGLTLMRRETYLNSLIDALQKNCDTYPDKDIDLTRKDFLSCAIDLEYEVFSSSTITSLYQRALAFKVRNLTKIGRASCRERV